MSETGDSANVLEADLPEAQGPQVSEIEGPGAQSDLSVADQVSIDKSRWAETELDLESVQLLTRFLMGAAFVYGDELFERLRFFQQEIDAEPWALDGHSSLDQASNLALLRYLAVGLMARGQRMLGNAAQRTFRAAVGTTSWALGRADRLTDNPLTGPVRRRIAARAQAFGQGTAQIIREGQREEQVSRRLAGQTINEIIDEVLDYVAENPEIQASIRHLVAQQGVGLANVVADNSRTVTVAADYVAERLVRRILRRAPRAELPPSPLTGMPQTMYQAEAPKTGEDNDVE
jgi:hypothetical protein